MRTAGQWTAATALAWSARLLVLLAALAASWLAAPSAALAHASLVAAEPLDGASLAEAPASVTLHFDEVVTPLSLRVVGPDGAAVPLPGLPGPGPVLSASLPAGLPAGVYLVGWRVVSADGHPVAGALAFGIGTVAAPAAIPVEDNQATAWATVLQGLRLAFYAALVIAAGGGLFRLLVAEPPRRVRRGMVWAGGLGIVVAASTVGSLGGLLAEASWHGVLDPAVWALGAGTPLATSMAIAAAGFAIIAFSAVASRHTVASWIGAGGAVLVTVGFPLAGHAATAEPRWLAAVALTVHALVVAFWLGAFWPLRALLTDRGTACTPAVERFSRLALPAVAALLAAGVALAALRLRTPGELLHSAYGQLVLIKASGFVLLLALAGLNRQRLTPALAVQDRAATRLSRSILAEMVVAGAVLCVTTALVRTPPPSATEHGMAGHEHHPSLTEVADSIAVATEAGGLAALVEISPGRAGINRLSVYLSQASGAPLAPPAEVWAEFEQATAGVGPFRRQLQPDGGGHFVHDGPEMALPGRWSVRVEVLVSDFEQVLLPADVDLRPATP